MEVDLDAGPVTGWESAPSAEFGARLNAHRPGSAATAATRRVAEQVTRQPGTEPATRPATGPATARVLVLNATYEPLGVVAWRRAVVLVLDAKAEVLHSTGRDVHSARHVLPEPSVVRLSYHVKVPYQTRMALNRRAVFIRDGYRCQYCGGPAESIDHVIPRARGGEHTWDNVVAACRRCNTKKEDRLAHEAGLTLRRQPRQPRDRLWLLRATCGVHRDWEPYLGASPLSA